MKILFDQGTPAPLRRELLGHDCSTAHEMGWSDLNNGALLAEAEQGFDLLITTDQNIPYQQSLAGRRVAILVLPTTSWPKIQQPITEVVAAVLSMSPSEYRELSF